MHSFEPLLYVKIQQILHDDINTECYFFLGGFIYFFKNEVRKEILDKWQDRSAKSKTIVLILH